MNKISLGLSALCVLLAAWNAQAQPKDLRPANDEVIVEKLSPRLARPQTSSDPLAAVQQAIQLARQTADPRYLGQAQALLGAQWGNPQASYEAATLQATIEQSRHEFAQARQTLKTALTKPSLTSSHAQAWLTLATIERVQGNYAAAQAACKSISSPAAQLYASACLLETRSLQGQWSQARQGLNALLREQRLPAQQAWLQSLMAENEERAGNAASALKLYALSLSLDADGYTALAYADALLRNQTPALALAALHMQPSSDAVLIRRAAAYKQLGDLQWQALGQELQTRFAAAAQRGGTQAGHAREQALFELLVRGNAQAALSLAKSNLALQREPLDWLIAMQSAQQLGQPSEAAALKQAAAATGLKDARQP
jgi:tetratricopeptide (TPR) repeat protein